MNVEVFDVLELKISESAFTNDNGQRVIDTSLLMSILREVLEDEL